jgi:hypothetical protein
MNFEDVVDIIIRQCNTTITLPITCDLLIAGKVNHLLFYN